MLGEDFALFFNTDEHAVRATISTPEGGLVIETNVILSLPVGEVQLGSGEVSHLQPSLQCPTAELVGVKKGYRVVINDPEGQPLTFHVVRRENDGTGLSTVFMVKQ